MAEENFHIYPWATTYSEVKWAIKILNKKSRKSVKSMQEAIDEQKGNVQRPVKWKNPSEWIPQRLDGEEQKLALEIWEGSDKSINPRYLHQVLHLVVPNNLLSIEEGVYKKTELGDKFLNDDLKTIQSVDRNEGIDSLLAIIKKNPSSKTSDLFQDWSDFLVDVGSKMRKKNAIIFSLYRRLNNLIDRGLISKEKFFHNITKKGEEHLNSIVNKIIKTSETDFKRNEINMQIKEHNREVRKKLHEKLSSMPPRNFEFFIKELLVATNSYDEVEVTQYTNDGGIDLKAKRKIQIGEMDLFTIEEVFQVKRWKHNVPTGKINDFVSAMEQDRASYGTFITLSDFSNGAYKIVDNVSYAKIITLINGQQLLDIVENNGVGIKKRSVNYLIELKEDDLEIKEETEIESE